MKPEDLLERMAATLRGEIGPAVAEPFAKTQAFMAAVVLQKLGAQLRLADSHAAAERDDLAGLIGALDDLLGAGPPAGLLPSLDALRRGETSALGGLVAALYAEREVLGRVDFDACLTRVRAALRRHLDRQLEYAA